MIKCNVPQDVNMKLYLLIKEFYSDIYRFERSLRLFLNASFSASLFFASGAVDGDGEKLGRVAIDHHEPQAALALEREQVRVVREALGNTPHHRTQVHPQRQRRNVHRTTLHQDWMSAVDAQHERNRGCTSS